MMDPKAMPSDAMGADDGSGAEAGPQELYTIEITALDDGTFSVEMETGAQEEGEESGAGEGSESSEGAQTADSFSKAMEIANSLYESKAGADGQSKKAGFDSVFGPGAGAKAAGR